MPTQILPINYGSKEKLEEKLLEILGDNNYHVVKRLGTRWTVEVVRYLTEAEIQDVHVYMRTHFEPTR